MEKRFLCTACGACCYGLLPLSLKDAVAHADLFPLAMVWSPLRQGAKAFNAVGELGDVIQLHKRKKLALQIMAMAYIPPSMSCPALTEDGLCRIHETKPSRCRAMPFYPYRDEADQAEQLVPRPGWKCDTSEDAPVVYRDGRILERDDFECELKELQEQVPLLRTYAEKVMRTAPNVLAALEKAAKKKMGGRVVLGFTGVLPRLDGVDPKDFARRQLPVMEAWAEKTAGQPDLADFHKHYRDGAAGLAYLAKDG